MASAKPSILRPLLTPRHNHLRPLTHRRTFLPNPFASSSPAPSSPQILKASRTLPYPSAPVYSIIADVPSYSSFLPYCQRSDITQWSAPDSTYSRRWPSSGILTSGFGAITESFASRVYCVPGRYVESVGGAAETSLNKADIAHHLGDEGAAAGGTSTGALDRGVSAGLLTHLRSTWTVDALGAEQTRVSLVVEFAFANPLYAALSGGVAPKVAEFMVKAFEQRVEEVLRRSPEMRSAELGDLEGSAMKKG